MGAASSTPLALTLHDAIDRGLKANLGLLVSDSASESARGQRLQALSALLPQLDAKAGETDRTAQPEDHRIQSHDPGRHHSHHCRARFITPTCAPTRPGTHSTTARAKNYRSAVENRRAAQLSVMDARDLVVQATASAYLQIIADASRVEAIRSQVETAQALYDRTADQQRAGTAAGIDVLRSQVELKQQQQRLLAQTKSVRQRQARARPRDRTSQRPGFQSVGDRAVCAADVDDAGAGPGSGSRAAAGLSKLPGAGARGGGRRAGGARRALSHRRRHRRLRRRRAHAQQFARHVHVCGFGEGQSV